MNKASKYILIGIGVLALVGVGLFASAQVRRRRTEQDAQIPPTQQALPQQDNISVVASRVLDKIGGRF